MRLHVDLDSRAARTAFISIAIGISGLLLCVVLCDYLVASLTDERVAIVADTSVASFITDPFTGDGANPAVLEAALHYFPNSPSLHVKLAGFERNWPGSEHLSVAASHAARA